MSLPMPPGATSMVLPIRNPRVDVRALTQIECVSESDGVHLILLCPRRKLGLICESVMST
jgi:hypothetical protein